MAVKDLTDRQEHVREQRRALPDAPGVYLFRDARRRVLYVGKAKSLRKRVGGHLSGLVAGLEKRPQRACEATWPCRRRAPAAGRL